MELHRRVRDYWIPNDGWNWEVLETLLPTSILDKIAALTILDYTYAPDCLCWGVRETGSFTVSTAYDIAVSSDLQHKDKDWKVL